MGNKPVCSLWELGKGMTAEKEQRYVEPVLCQSSPRLFILSMECYQPKQLSIPKISQQYHIELD